MNDYQLPLPFVTGGFGLLLAFVLPGGLSGGEGFLAGFATGMVLLVLQQWVTKRQASQASVALSRCPKCGTTLTLQVSEALPSSENRGSSHRDERHE